MSKYKIAIAALVACGVFVTTAPSRAADGPVESFDLPAFVAAVLRENMGVKISRDVVREKTAVLKVKQVAFFPRVAGQYRFEQYDEKSRVGSRVTDPEIENTLALSVSQPVFSGFSRLNQYRMATDDLGIAELNQRLTRQTVVFESTQAYYQYLKARKHLRVMAETVYQIQAHKDTADHFFNAGKIPRDDLLQAQVELANARQAEIVARNGRQLALARINTLLRRPLHRGITLADDTGYTPYEARISDCQDLAARHRPELAIADLEIRVAKRRVALARKDYYPSVDLQGSYFNRGSTWELDGGPGIYNPKGWRIMATAAWELWDWGARKNGVAESRARLSQARLRKIETLDRVRFEVQQAYLNTLESEKNIAAVAHAIAQALSNLKAKKERYEHQMATSTDVLDAQTLVTRTRNNYYNALYDFKLARASLEKAMGVAR